LCELRYAFEGHDRASLEMHLEAVIVRTWRPRSSEFGDALSGHDRSRLEDLEEVDQEGGTTGAESLFIG